ncbi:MAG: ABC transporter permease [Rhodothermaceae bacterium]|nr:MAG: ABC transporter permease [Rhodothermaceae bacterium]
MNEQATSQRDTGVVALPHRLDWANVRRKLVHIGRALKIAWEAAGPWTTAWGVMLLLQGLFPAATVYLTKVVVDAFTGSIGGDVSFEHLKPVIVSGGLLVAILILGQVVQQGIIWVRNAQAELVTDHIKALIHRKTARVDLEFYDIPEYFDHMARANEEADRRVLTILEGTGAILQNLVTITAISGILLAYGWWVPLVLFGSTLPALHTLLVHQRIYHAWWRGTTQQRRWARYFDRVITGRESAQEVRLFGLSERFLVAYQRVRKNLRDAFIRLSRRQRTASLFASLWALAATGGIMVWMVLRAIRGLASLGDVALFYQAFTQGQGLMRALLSSVGTLYADALFLEHLFTFLELEPRVRVPAQPKPVPATLRHGITVDNVSFRYPGSDYLALDGFNLFIPAGKTVAIVGKNGAGKSTLIKLLCRFYDPEAGAVRWDDVDIRDVDPRDLWRHVTVLFQYPVNYAGTVRESIAYGNVEVPLSDERLQWAIEAAGARSIVDQLPRGLDTMLGKEFEGGVDLSGGQWQRIALARAFYRDAPLVLLDEPTSFMDSWAEMQWLDRFRDLVRGRTALIVTHRFTTAMRADLIYVMESGHLVESGTHEQLLAQGGLYAESWQKQIQAERNQLPAFQKVENILRGE